jgi:chromosome partitioning protein
VLALRLRVKRHNQEPFPHYLTAKVGIVQVVSVSSLKGGVGKTTVTLGLASAAFAKGLRTLVIDMDPQSDVSAALASRSSHGYSIDSVLNNTSSSVVRQAVVPSSWSGPSDVPVHIMMGSPSVSAHDKPTPTKQDLWKLEEALATIESQYDLVLIDCPPSFNGLTQTAWTAADSVVIIAEPGLFSVTAVHRTLLALQAMRMKMSPRLRTAGVIINRYRADSPEHVFRLEEMKQLFGDHILEPIIDETLTLQQSTGAAIPIHRWPGETAQSIARYFERLLVKVLIEERV